MALRPVVLLFLGAVLALTAARADAVAAETTGLPLPRFVSLRADEVNLRTGPGVQHPIDWVYRRRHLPVEIIAEYNTWRKIRDWQGTEGWVHQSMLSNKRTVVVTGKLRTLRHKSDTTGRPVAQAEAGVIARLLECPDASTWCRVEVDGFEGWFRRVEFWGAYGDEVVR
ncbi:MAG: SH3 domain-containing protein [Rhodospirillales bacterium]|jgi:SH3-like domain-containing protein|nr:SH3 domain-containing protein [Rhodospirillales bacterium]MDP6773479.1 SH3 domain-containing protein [Rhodospirillales bacterium]